MLNPQYCEIEAFYDGDCPLCLREVNLLKRLDRRHKIHFTNIAAPDFDPAVYGKTQNEFMQEMQGRLPDGSWVTGVEVFRRLYSAIGLRWLMLPTRLPGISHGLDYLYSHFARHRLKLTGRCQQDQCELKQPRQEVHS
jgi:predicted DCC family thiol-disulfide oxidoreductase YuxK